MNIFQIKDKKQYNKFVAGQKHSQFLQAWQWGDFHKQVSGKIWRLGVEEAGKLIVAVTIIEKVLPAGKKYFYCPRGPVINLKNRNEKIKNIEKLLFNEIEKLAKREGVMFLRFDPMFSVSDITTDINNTLDVQPSKTLILNLDKNENELLKEMRQKTRYNIRLAEKKGVKIREAGLGGFEAFWDLLSQTGDRDKFRLHGRDYYEEMLKLDDSFIKLFLAEYRGKVIAANIISFFGDTVTYVHGASAGENRNVMAPYLLQWQVIKLAEQEGYKYYDFYGIDEEKWPGVTKFKRGFGGRAINYPGTFDLVFDRNWYNIYKMIRRVRRTF